MSWTPEKVLEAKPGLALVQKRNAERESRFRERCLAKMAEIVKVARKGEPCDVTDGDIADISRFLREFSSRHDASKLLDMMSQHPGMVHS